MTALPGRTGRRIDGTKLSIDLNQNVILASPGGVRRVGPLVAEFIEVVLRSYPDPAPFKRLVRELYPSATDRPLDVRGAIHNIVKRARRALKPVGFDILAVRPIHSEDPSAYQIVKLNLKPKSRGMMVVPPPKGFEL